jgi:PIN domain nuclease of toxin-antitoxin system
LLDSFALLAWLNEEPGVDRVDGLLKAARRSHRSLLMNAINVGEVYTSWRGEACGSPGRGGPCSRYSRRAPPP